MNRSPTGGLFLFEDYRNFDILTVGKLNVTLNIEISAAGPFISTACLYTRGGSKWFSLNFGN